MPVLSVPYNLPSVHDAASASDSVLCAPRVPLVMELRNGAKDSRAHAGSRFAGVCAITNIGSTSGTQGPKDLVKRIEIERATARQLTEQAAMAERHRAARENVLMQIVEAQTAQLMTISKRVAQLEQWQSQQQVADHMKSRLEAARVAAGGAPPILVNGEKREKENGGCAVNATKRNKTNRARTI